MVSTFITIIVIIFIIIVIVIIIIISHLLYFISIGAKRVIEYSCKQTKKVNSKSWKTVYAMEKQTRTYLPRHRVDVYAVKCCHLTDNNVKVTSIRDNTNTEEWVSVVDVTTEPVNSYIFNLVQQYKE